MSPALCAEDLVTRKGDATSRVATVERTHADVDTHEPQPWRREEAPLIENDSLSNAAVRKFMKDGIPPKGTVYIRWVNLDKAELIPEDQLELLHRALYIGDIVTRGTGHAMSGVVLNVDTRCMLRPMGTATVTSNGGKLFSILPFDGSEDDLVRNSHRPSLLEDVPVSELKYEESPAEDDLVVYKGWIGRVMSMSCAVTIRLTDNSAVEVSEEVLQLLSDHPDVPRLGDLVRTKKGNLRTGIWKYGSYNANTPPIGTVVSTRAVSVEVAWLMARLGGQQSGREPSALLERDELESQEFQIYDRSRRPRSSNGELTVSNSEIETAIGLRVRFRDLAAATAKYDGSTPHGKLDRIPRQDTLGYDMNVLEVASISADVAVQWQDLTITTERTVDLIPDTSIDDEHAAWPGEIAHTLAMTNSPGEEWKEKPGKVGVVQCVRPAERMAVIKWCPGARISYSRREGDPMDPLTGSRELVEGVVGVADGDTEELSLYDVEAPAVLNVRRGDIVLVSSERAVVSFSARPQDTCWLGEVVDTKLDGRLLVRLGAADVVKDVPLNREDVIVAIRSDGTDELEDLADAAAMSEEYDPDGYLDEEDWRYTDPRIPRSDVEMAEELGAEATYVDENGDTMDIDDVEDEEWESDDGDNDIEVDVDGAAERHAPSPQSARPQLNTPPTDPPPETPEQHIILDTPLPPDHHYASTTPTFSLAHTKRVAKEHKILRTPGSLPQGVYVRSWESRLDCLRVLFIGPEETPYAYGPFIIDLHLPSDYPHAPPKAFFHSWVGESGLGGVGRVNPNLYEDGKICLSLLGTWDGEEKGESWNGARSTLLQVIVSVLGLVLVREPYFNEAGYEPLTGLESSKRPSALYSERTLLRSMGFLVSAVSAVKGGERLPGLGGLENELRWLYIGSEGPGLLSMVTDRVAQVLKRSEGEEKEIDGLSVVSKGACIPLQRVLGRLEALGEVST